MTKMLTSDPAVAMELGRRLAVNAQRQPRLPRRLGAVLSRFFTAGHRPAVKKLRARA